MRRLILLVFMIVATITMDAWAEEGYEDLPEIKKLIKVLNQNSNRCLTKRNVRFCRKGKKPRGKGTGWCYMYVKIGLVKSGMTSEYIGGGSAKNAGPYLEKEGFVNILKTGNYTPIEIPNGSIFVYARTFSPHGHIEVKVDKDKYVSDYVRTETSGQLIGIYIKKKLKLKEREDDSFIYFNSLITVRNYSSGSTQSYRKR